MARPRLFVKSKKINVPIGHIGSYFTRVHTQTKTEYHLLPNDSQAKDLLVKSGTIFELVDLSKGVKTDLIAKLRGVRETPTLEVEGGSVKRYVGLKAISDYVSTVRTQTLD